MRHLLITALVIVPAASRAADPAAFLPASTDLVVTIQARQIAESDLGRRIGADLIQQLVRASKEAAYALEASGLDPIKDFEVITVGLDLDNTDDLRPFVLFEGKVDTRRVEAAMAGYMTDHPARMTAVTVAGKGAYKIAGGKPGEAMYAGILDDTRLAVAATPADLAGAYAAAAGGRKPVISRELANLLVTAKSPAPIFARAWVKGKLNDVKLPNEKVQAQVRTVDWATMALTVTRDVSLTLTMNAADAAAARTMSDLLGGVVGLIRLQIMAAAEDQPELQPLSDLLRATRVAPVGNTVVATGSVKGDALVKALKPTTPAKK